MGRFRVSLVCAVVAVAAGVAGNTHLSLGAEVFTDPDDYANAAAAAGAPTQTLIDFEDLSEGASIDDDYAGLGLVFTSSSSITAQTSVHGSQAIDSLALQVGGDTPQSFTLLFDRDQRAVAAYYLDIFTTLTLQAYDSGGLVETALLEGINVEDTPGGVFRGVVFDSPFTRLVIQGEAGDGIGIDNLLFTSTDQDGDGYGPGTGRWGDDCDDTDPSVHPGALEEVDGKDQDCDGIADNAYQVFSSETAFSQSANDAGIPFLTVLDFEDLTEGAPVETAYEGLGVYLSAAGAGGPASLTAVPDVCGSPAMGTLAALPSDTDHAAVTWFFERSQYYLATRFLDVDDAGLVLEAYTDGGLVNTFSFQAEGEDTARGIFRGFWFNYPVTRVVVSSPTSTDCIGFDDLQFLSLDEDADGYGTAPGNHGDDCDDTSPDVYPGAQEVDGNGIDEDCDGIVDNAVTTYTDPALFEADGTAGGVPGFAIIDFETLADNEAVTTQYQDVGILFSSDGGITATSDVYGSRSRGQRAARVEATHPAVWTWTFTEPQRWVAGYFLDTTQSIKVDAYRDDERLNTVILVVPGEDTPGGFFRGIRFSIPVDRLEFQGLTASDGIGFDDVYLDPVDDDGDGFTLAEGDCNDLDPDIRPDAEESCNGADDNCDGNIDEGFDQDADGAVSCAVGSTPADCNDADPDVFPGREETCDAKDNDCNDEIDEGFDLDGDSVTTCGDATTGPDCDDADPSVHPGADETCNGIDDDCDGDFDEGFDQDLDTYFACDLEGRPADCNDSDPDIHPGATDVPYNGVDEDCSGDDLTDADEDGYPSTQVEGGTDCDDTDSAIYPGQAEIPYDGVDQDCSGADLTDTDGDGFDATQVEGGTDCDDTNPFTYPGASEIDDDLDNDCDGDIDENLDTTDDDGDGLSEADGDCDDANPDVHPGATEIPYDGIDNDCSDGDLTDADEDGYPSTQVEGGTDCNDTDATVHPGTIEIPYDGIDNDCSDGDLTDADEDGYPSTEIDGGTDCNDDDSAIYPGQDEIPYDGVDQDCSGADLTDADEDGFDATVADGDDCDDANPDIHPGALELPDGVDNDCNGVIDDGTDSYDDDGDGYTEEQGDCNDANPDIHPGALEIDDDLDNNCDGNVDEGLPTTDDDGDGFSEADGDCDDADPNVYPGTAGCLETSPTPEPTPTPGEETPPEQTPADLTPTPADYPGGETPADTSPTPFVEEGGGCNCRTGAPSGSHDATGLIVMAAALFPFRRRGRSRS